MEDLECNVGYMSVTSVGKSLSVFGSMYLTFVVDGPSDNVVLVVVHVKESGDMAPDSRSSGTGLDGYAVRSPLNYLLPEDVGYWATFANDLLWGVELGTSSLSFMSCLSCEARHSAAGVDKVDVACCLHVGD